MHNKALRTIAATSLAVALVGAIITLFVPTPAGAAKTTFHALFFITTVMVITHFGAAILFTLGLTTFSKDTKRAYAWLVAGFVILALGFTQLPLQGLLHWEDSVWSRYGLIALPFVVSVVCIYAGARSFARLFGVKHPLTSLPVAIALSLGISVLSVLLPNAAPNIVLPETTIQVSKFALMLPATFNLWAAILAFQARKRAGALYVPATAWLAAYLALDSVSSMSGVVARLIQPGQNIGFDAGYMFILYAVAGVVLLKAGLAFNEIAPGRNAVAAASEVTFFGRPKTATTERGTLPDVLVYTAGLASDKEAVDPILEELRLVTANHTMDAPYNPAEQQRLAATYLQLETYLATQEPVRPVSGNDLQATVHSRFTAILTENPVFAQAINPSNDTTFQIPAAANPMVGSPSA